jgi:hypothetical protein
MCSRLIMQACIQLSSYALFYVVCSRKIKTVQKKFSWESDRRHDGKEFFSLLREFELNFYECQM